MGNLRVMGGGRRGFPLASPRGLDLRPTSGRVREALFDILGDLVVGSRFLDLYAGTGAVGIEALSRGAARCLFLERDRAAVAMIRRNLETCGFTARGEVIAGSLPAALGRLPRGERYDLVFLDPPYEDRSVAGTLEGLGDGAGLAPGSRVILEHRKSWEPQESPGRLTRVRSVRYGDSVLSFFVPRAVPAATGQRED